MIYAIYDMNENLITICENYKELCNFFKKTIRSMQCSVCRNVKGQIDYIVSNYDNKKYKVYKIRS